MQQAPTGSEGSTSLSGALGLEGAMSAATNPSPSRYVMTLPLPNSKQTVSCGGWHFQTAGSVSTGRLPKHAVLRPQVVDDRKLPGVDPARHPQDQKPQGIGAHRGPMVATARRRARRGLRARSIFGTAEPESALALSGAAAGSPGRRRHRGSRSRWSDGSAGSNCP